MPGIYRSAWTLKIAHFHSFVSFNRSSTKVGAGKPISTLSIFLDRTMADIREAAMVEQENKVATDSQIEKADRDAPLTSSADEAGVILERAEDTRVRGLQRMSFWRSKANAGYLICQPDNQPRRRKKTSMED